MRIKPLVALLFWIREFDDVRRTHSIGAVHGCPGNEAVRMRRVLARPWVGVRVCHLLLMLFFYLKIGLPSFCGI